MRYRTKSVETEAVMFDGTNLPEVQALAPPGMGTFTPMDNNPFLMFAGPSGRRILVHPGWWVHYDGIRITISEPGSFAQVWERVSE